MGFMDLADDRSVGIICNQFAVEHVERDKSQERDLSIIVGALGIVLEGHVFSFFFTDADEESEGHDLKTEYESFPKLNLDDDDVEGFFFGRLLNGWYSMLDIGLIINDHRFQENLKAQTEEEGITFAIAFWKSAWSSNPDLRFVFEKG
jgi:hypothetical protein